MSASPEIAVIIGSGMDALAGGGTGQSLSTRFGVPSANIRTSNLAGTPILTLARHGDEHSIPPHAINYRANLVAIQELGARVVVALNTVGVVSGVRDTGQIAVPDQILDYTWGREHTIFDGCNGVVEHIEFTEPFAETVRRHLLDAAKFADIDCYDGGVYAAMQGPRLESAAEVDRLERDGADFIGMTAMPEASIARELGLDYACVAMIVNRAAGRGDKPIHDDVEASSLAANAQAIALLHELGRMAAERL